MPGLSSLRMRRPRLTFTMAFTAPAFGAGLPAPSLIARAAAGAPQARGYQRSRSSRLPAMARRTGLGWSLLRLRAAPQRRRPTPTIPGLVQQLRAFRARCTLCSGLAASLGIPGGSRAAHPASRPSGQETNASSGTSGSRGHFPRPMSGCRRGRGTRVRASARVCASWLPVRRPQGAGGRGAALHPRAGVPGGSALAPPPGDPRRRRLDRVPAPEDRARIPETLQCRSWLGLSPRAPRHAEAQPRGGGRAGKPGSGVDPFRRGRPGGARLCFCCPLVPAPRAPPRASAAIPSPQNTPARRPSGVTSRALTPTAQGRKPLNVVCLGSGDGCGFWDHPRSRLHLNGFRHPSLPAPPNPRPRLKRRLDLNRHSPRCPPAPTPSQARARAEVSPELSLQLEPNRRGRPRSTKGSVPKGHFWSDALSSEGFSPRKQSHVFTPITFIHGG